MILPPLVYPVLSIVSLIQEKSPKRHLHKQLFAAFASKKFQRGKQEVNGTVILPPLVLPVLSIVSLVQGKSPRRHLHERLFAAFASKIFQPVEQEVNGTVILPPLVHPVLSVVSLVQGTKASAVIATTAGNFSDENAAKKTLV